VLIVGMARPSPAARLRMHHGARALRGRRAGSRDRAAGLDAPRPTAC
jgi:hypothetical protein